LLTLRFAAPECLDHEFNLMTGAARRSVGITPYPQEVSMALIDLYRDSLNTFAARVAAVGPDQWSRPTPCAEWDVRDLVNHVVSEQRWSVPLFAGATIEEVGDRYDGDVLGADPVVNAAEAAEDATAAVSEGGAMDRIVHLSFGDTPATEYVHQLLADHLVHGWDLAVAVGADATIDPAGLAECARWFDEREDLYRGGGAIGPRVELGPDASDTDRLVARFGRDPGAWRA
jgi:uncharacterized protein (TIGR03086 family)